MSNVGKPQPASEPLSRPQPRPSTAAPARRPSPPPITSEDSYVLGAGDRLQVTLFQLPQYSGEQEVQVDGSLNLPLVGRVVVADQTLEQASATISAAYSQVLRRPIVTLNLTGRRPLEVGIAGEVARPGSYTLSPNNTNYPTLAQLLEVAGGITQSADLRQVEVRRQEGGRNQVLRVDLWQLLQTGDSRYNIALRDGDSIFIPATLVPLNEGPLLADSTFYADRSVPIEIAVVGEVFRPGPYTVRGGFTRTGDAGEPGGSSNDGSSLVTVTDAIRVAGGIKPQANVRQVQVRRVSRSGDEQIFNVDLWSMLQTGDLKQDAILQSGDTVVVPVATALDPSELSEISETSFAPDSITINVVGEVRRAGSVAIPPNTPLNQGILAAGGFNNRARQDVVLLVRLNPDGTVTRKEVPIDFAQGIDEANNPLLQNNDIIIVGTSGFASFADSVGTFASPIADILTILGAPFRLFNFFD